MKVGERREERRGREERERKRRRKGERRGRKSGFTVKTRKKEGEKQTQDCHCGQCSYFFLIFFAISLSGCVMVEGGSWRTAPPTATILGLQGLPSEDNAPLYHHHLCFGYAYNQQSGWRELLGRFVEGGGSLLDIAYLVGTCAFVFYPLSSHHHLSSPLGLSPLPHFSPHSPSSSSSSFSPHRC